MRSIKFKKTFVFRVALASVMSLVMSLSALCYTGKRIESLESRLQLLETHQEVNTLPEYDLELELFEDTKSVTLTAEDELRAVQDTPAMSTCDNADCTSL